MQLRFINGDTILVVSGSEMTSTDAAVSVLQKLRRAHQVEVWFVRKGERPTLEVEIR